MKLPYFLLTLVCLLSLQKAATAQLDLPAPAPIKFARQPSLAPDGMRFAFSWQGDIWTVPVAGGAASRVTIHQAHDQLPAWSPDGRWIAFSSNREGNYDVWVVPANGGSPRQLTFHSADDLTNGWSPDGTKVLFHATREATRSTALYTVDVKSGATRMAAEDIVPVSHGSFSPDGKEIYHTRYGSWTRKNYRGSGQGDLMARPAAGGAGRLVTKTPENERWPLLTSRGDTLYFVSDKDGTPNLWRQSLNGGEPAQVTKFKEGNLFYPTLSRGGDRIVFEHDFQIWSVDLKPGQNAPPRVVSILAPTDLKANPIRRETYRAGAQESQLSPDGKQVAFVVHGELFVVPLAGGEGVRLTKTSAREQDIVWSPDSAKVAFISDRNGESDIYVVDVKSKAETQLTRSAGVSENAPIFSPNGKQIAYLRGLNGQELIVASSQGGGEMVIARGPSMSSHAWSPDGKWLAFHRMKSHSAGSTANVFVIPSAGGNEINVTRYPGLNLRPVWSADGKRLVFASNRTTQVQVWSVPLQDERNEPAPSDPPKETPKDAAKKPVEVKIDVEDIHRRARQMTSVDTGVIAFTVSPDSRAVLYSAREGSRVDIWRVGLDGGTSTRLTQTGETGTDIHFGTEASRALYRSGGQIRSISLAPPAPSVSTIAFSARMDVDIREEMLQMFDEAWRKMRDGFYDEKMHGVDWSGIRTRYRPVVSDLTHKEDFYTLFTLALGELNASHTGISAGQSGGSSGGPTTPTLGIAVDETFSGPGVRAQTVLPRGPADREKSRIKPGEIVLKVDGEPVTTNERFYALLADRAGKTLEVMVNDKPGEQGARVVKIEPISIAEHKRLEYDRWTREREQLVTKLSNGRLGYIHLDSMGPSQLERFRREALGDLEEKEGVVLDVRFNGGGSIADEMFSILQNRVFGYRTLRGDPAKLPAPMPAFTRPLIVLINEGSFSNAEVFPWGFKALKLGKVVGTPTYGGVIGTGGADLIDGSSLRMPAVGSYTVDGLNMENNGCPPDILVEPTPEDIHAERDPQLERAVQELVKQLDSEKK